jgi:sugar phosphate isomerase/epimerase
MKPSLTRRTFLKRTAAVSAAVLASTGPSSGGEASPAAPAFAPRFAICNETFEDWPFEKVCEFSAECGYGGVEIAPFTLASSVTDVSATKRAELRKQVESHGLEVAGLHWLLAKTKGLYLTSPERDVRKRTAEYLEELARFCADLGGKLLIFGSPKQRDLLPGVTHQNALEYAKEVFRRTLPVLEKTDVKIAIEPLAPRTTTFLRTAEEALDLVKLVDSPRFQLILDCYAMSTEKRSIPELIRANRSHLVHFHSNDPNGQGPGFGKLDFVPILEALRDIRYRGWISVEVFDTSPGAEALARKSIRSLRGALGKLTPAPPAGT